MFRKNKIGFRTIELIFITLLSYHVINPGFTSYEGFLEYANIYQWYLNTAPIRTAFEEVIA